MSVVVDPRSFDRLFRLDGRVAVVTGAASGLGKATARLMVSAGAKVVVADIDRAGVEAVAAELGDQALPLWFDLQDDASVQALFDETVKVWGGVDILVNNAGIYPRYSLDALTREQWDEMQRVNVWGSFVALRSAAQKMRATGRGGRIINISSIGAVRTAVNNQIAYNASKAALDSMTLSAALDLAKDGILVNSVLPGAIRPLEPMPKPAGHHPASGPLQSPGRILLGRAALADEVAGPILMLASAAGAYITGQTLVIDGGFSIS